MSTAARRFFAITELLEMVLLEPAISPTQVMALQRVDKNVQATIFSSPTLQRKMFMSQLPCPAGADVYEFCNDDFSLNTTLATLPKEGESWSDRLERKWFRLPSDPYVAYYMCWNTKDVGRKYDDHPRALYIGRHASVSSLLQGFPSRQMETYDSLDNVRLLPAAFLKTYLTDKRSGFYGIFEIHEDGTSHAARICVAAGATLGDTMEAFRKWMAGELP